MKKFEYKIIIFDCILDSLKDVQTAMDTYGNLGWELVTITKRQDGRNEKYFFKKEIIESMYTGPM